MAVPKWLRKPTLNEAQLQLSLVVALIEVIMTPHWKNVANDFKRKRRLQLVVLPWDVI